MLAAVGSDLDHVVHVDVYLLDIADFETMNAAYIEAFGEHRPARTAIGVAAPPKGGRRWDDGFDGRRRLRSELARQAELREQGRTGTS